MNCTVSALTLFLLAPCENGGSEAIDLAIADSLASPESVTTAAATLELPQNTLTADLVMLTWRDFYSVDPDNGWPSIDQPALTVKLCSALKPGAVLGISDHVANTGTDVPETAQALHRIDPERVVYKFTCK